MSNRYQVLARRYRPQTFRDVVGQEAAVTTLKNAIRFNKIAHAYLFCGSRGIGKTSLARLFAKALNCQNLGEDFEPCGRCSSCRDIAASQSLDVIEIDGASNRGIDDIRQINETVGYSSSHGGYKIYIIDEVHMLTKEAFNALLKTLEEPPEKVKFFFATTEPHKVLPTIISRTQRFDLARIKPDLIIQKLTQIGSDLQREIEKEALELIANFSDGSLRDAESLLDQIFCFSDASITASVVRQSLGLAPNEIFHTLNEAFHLTRLETAFEIVEKLFETGKDLSHFYEQLIGYFRDIVSKKMKKLSDPILDTYSTYQAIFILDLLIDGESSFQKSAFQRTSLEAILLKIIRSKNRIPTEVLIRHLIENKDLSSLKTSSPSVSDITAPEKKPEPAFEKALPKPEIPSPEKKPEPAFEKAPLMPEEAPLLLKSVPFNPFNVEIKKEEAPKPSPQITQAVEEKHPSYYDTIIRFASVEFEGTIKT